MSRLTEPFEAAYMQRALVAMLVLSVLCGVVGALVHLRRLAFEVDALTHCIFPGVAAAFFTHSSLFVGALIAAGTAAAVLTLTSDSRRIDPDAMLALILAVFFSIGVIIVSRNSTYTADLSELLFGRMLTLAWSDVAAMSVVALAAIALLAACSKELVFRAFDPQASEAMGYSPRRLDLVANIAVALVVVAAARAVGTALIIALLITPTAAARLVSRRVGSLVGAGICIAAVTSLVGLWVSYDASINGNINLAPGATVIAALTLVFIVLASAQAVRSHTRSTAR